MTRLPASILLGAVVVVSSSGLHAQTVSFTPTDRSHAPARPKITADFSGRIVKPAEPEVQLQARTTLTQEPPTNVESAPLDCAMTVVVGGAAIDPAFSRPAPRDKNYTMRVVQSPKCEKK